MNPQYEIVRIYPNDRSALAMVDALLEQEGIHRDTNLDYICVMLDESYRVIATGSCFGNTLRCFAVSSAHQGEGLLNQIITHLMEVQFARGNLHLFLYTKCKSAKFFADLGFYEVARVEDMLVFMENRRDGFSDYLRQLETTKTGGKSVALVMNANPFTLGHQYLAETAAAACNTLHLFIISENVSLVPFAIRRKLVVAGTSHIKNIVYHDSGPYIISNATFPSYFLKDETDVIMGHARLDLTVFVKIAKALNITARYVGEEPTSVVTGLYNQVMRQNLPHDGIDCIVIPRRKTNGSPISASTARRCLKTGNWAALQKLVPATTYDYFQSEEARPVLERILKAGDVAHY
ncbi:[citrate (pro-3S)-lyase] ligase [Caproicibacterium sp. NSD3]